MLKHIDRREKVGLAIKVAHTSRLRLIELTAALATVQGRCARSHRRSPENTYER